MDEGRETSPETVEKLFGEYWIDGYPTVSFAKNNNVDKIFCNQYLGTAVGLGIPNPIGMIIMEIADINVFIGGNNKQEFVVVMNSPVETSQTIAWIRYQNIWNKFYLEQCSARYKFDKPIDKLAECTRVVVSPGNGSNSQYGSTAFSCCVLHVLGGRRTQFKTDIDTYSCRTCWQCVAKLRTIPGPGNLLHWSSTMIVNCAIRTDGFKVKDDERCFRGEVEFYNTLIKKRYKLKYDFIKLKYDECTMICTKPSTLYLNRLPPCSPNRSVYVGDRLDLDFVGNEYSSWTLRYQGQV